MAGRFVILSKQPKIDRRNDMPSQTNDTMTFENVQASCQDDQGCCKVGNKIKGAGIKRNLSHV